MADLDDLARDQLPADARDETGVWDLSRLAFRTYGVMALILAAVSVAGFVLAATVNPDLINMGIGVGFGAVLAAGCAALYRWAGGDRGA